MAEHCLNEAVRLGLTSDRIVAGVLHRVARRGRNGVGRMRIVLGNRLGWSNLTESQLEDEFVRIMRVAGIELPAPQVNISKRGGRLIARVDFVYPDIRLVIELDGERYHSDQNAFRKDRRKQNELVLEGYRVLRFTAWDVFATPEYVVASVVAALHP
jgi:very-short-patch-repair endonuclease